MPRSNESELSRDSFLETVSFIIVGYFCVSTEIRFLTQLRDEQKVGSSSRTPADAEVETKESEFWHAKSLEVATSVLPSDCPLLNHVLLSYQKHHAPSAQAIPEGQTQADDVIFAKPIYGIDQCKFHPVIRKVKGIKVMLSPSLIEPARH